MSQVRRQVSRWWCMVVLSMVAGYFGYSTATAIPIGWDLDCTGVWACSGTYTGNEVDSNNVIIGQCSCALSNLYCTHPAKDGR
ncbi:hypothetical protein FTUN_6009 [Frigoriglobus tundricola]|uniref:Uncharacterized protein n=1 Tax=Frigoriglobus tundricola TaxID=2774151 RepID=A0A6M5YWT3_9BACT|nr:hypothetical protein FTUN_6009 [Frigoriglobus tundricola]